MSMNIIGYLLGCFAVDELLQISRVSKRIHMSLKKTKVYSLMKKFFVHFRGLSFREMLDQNCQKIELFVLTDLIVSDLSLNDWRYVTEILIYYLNLKLEKDEKIEFLSKVERKSFHYLKETLSQHKFTKNLTIASNSLGKYQSKILSNIVHQNKLSVLDLTRCVFTKKGIKTFIETLENLNSNNPLKSLNLTRCQLGDRDTTKILKVFKGSKNLDFIDLTYNSLAEEPFVFLAKDFDSFCLKKLVLNFNEINQKGVKCLSTFLIKNKFIKTLSLISTIKRDCSFNNISKAISENSVLKRIDLGFNSLKDQIVKVFVESLKKNTNLESISIVFSEFSNDGMDMFSQFLSESSCTLKKLRLSNFDSTDRPAVFTNLFKALTKNESLIALNLFRCNLSQNHLLGISQVLALNKTLKKLNLNDNDIKSDITLLIDSIKGNSSLVNLNLSSNSFSNLDIHHFASSLLIEENCLNLEYLDLSNNQLTDDSIPIIIQLVKQRSYMKLLKLKKCGISKSGSILLEQALVYNKNLQISLK